MRAPGIRILIGRKIPNLNVHARNIIATALRYNIRLLSTRIPRDLNIITDELSKIWANFHTRTNRVQQHSTHLPQDRHTSPFLSRTRQSSKETHSAPFLAPTVGSSTVVASHYHPTQKIHKRRHV
jgi:hypothetical protein